MEFPGGLAGKESACSAEDWGSTPGSGKSPGEGNGNPLQYSGLGNPMNRGPWWATVHRVTKELDATQGRNHHKPCGLKTYTGYFPTLKKISIYFSRDYNKRTIWLVLHRIKTVRFLHIKTLPRKLSQIIPVFKS